MAPIELSPNDRETNRGGRSDAAYPGSAVQARLDRDCNQRLHFRWRHAATFYENRDGGRTDIGQHVQGRVTKGVSAPTKKRKGRADDDGSVTQRPVDEFINHR